MPRFSGSVSALFACGSLLLTACDESAEPYPFVAPTASGEDAPSWREPASARALYEEACSVPALDAGAASAAAASDAGAQDAGAADAGKGGPACSGGKVVHFVYFVEADREYSECWRARIEKQAYATQRYWHDLLGVTFYLNDPVVDVVMAEHESSWYLRTADGIHGEARWFLLGNRMTEVYANLGIEQFDPDHRVVNYPTTRFDGHVGANFGGAWMDGDDLTCMVTGLTYPYDEQNPAHCLGHPLHEFGHVLGLEHTGPESDCMQFGFYTDDPNHLCTFSADNARRILRNPNNAGWFEAEPGERCTGP